MQSLTEVGISALAELLAPLGWIRVSRRRDVFRQDTVGDLVYQLSASGTFDRMAGAVKFLPALGVRYGEAASVEGELLGLPKASYRFTATLGCGLMELLPLDRRNVSTRWRVSSPDEAEHIASAIRDDFINYGTAYYEKFDTVDSVISELMRQKRSHDQDGKLAILAALRGQTDKALEAIVRYAEIAESQVPPISVQSWNFVGAFAERFGIGTEFLPS